MSSSSIDGKLRRLDEKEITVLYWKCQGLSREIIGDRMGYGEDMIAVFSTRMYNKLEFDSKQHPSRRRRILDEEYCPALMSYGNTIQAIVQNLQSPPPEINPDPQIGSNGWIIVIQDDTREDVAKEINSAIEHHPEARLKDIPRLRTGIDDPGNNGTTRRPSAMVPWIITVLLISLVGIGAVILSRSFKPLSTDLTIKTGVPQPVSQVITQNVTQVITQVVTQNIVQVVQAVTIIAPTSPATKTPVATDTPQPNILFEDNFADGPDPRWQLQSTPDLAGDFLTTGQNAFWLYLPGDWKNYRVIIKYANWCDTTFCTSTFGLRAQNPANMVALIGGAGNSGVVGWNVVRNGQTTHIAKSDFTYPPTEGEITFEVVGDDFLVVGYPKVHVSGFDRGGLFLQIRKNMKLYSVKVVEIP